VQVGGFVTLFHFLITIRSYSSATAQLESTGQAKVEKDSNPPSAGIGANVSFKKKVKKNAQNPDIEIVTDPMEAELKLVFDSKPVQLVSPALRLGLPTSLEYTYTAGASTSTQISGQHRYYHYN